MEMEWILGQEWTDTKRGLKKKVINLNFVRVDKPTELSECRVRICNASDLYGRESSYLSQTNEFAMNMGSAVLPLDCYIERIVENMLIGETSQCEIQTNIPEQVIKFQTTLCDISTTKYLHELDIVEMYALAQKYRKNGVAMFPKYNKFAQDYFSRAAKCLISFKPFDPFKKDLHGIDCMEMQHLLEIIQCNLAASYLREQRFDDVLYLTAFIETKPLEQIKDWEKAVFRRATAYYRIKAFEEAIETLRKIDGVQNRKEFVGLYTDIKRAWRHDNEAYKAVMKNMFS